MTRIQEGCFPRRLFVLLVLLPCLLAASVGEPTSTAAAGTTKDVDLKTVKPLTQAKDGATTTKITTEPPKPTTDSKKKATSDFDKPKSTKFKDKGHDGNATTISTAKITSSTHKPSTNQTIEIPVLTRGEPSVATVFATTEPPTDSARARALNVTAAEPGNTLHSNGTDLSDVSMDDEDKEVEGGEYIAAHNGTSTSMMSVKPLPTVPPPGCTDGNRTYGIGEKIERGCEERCVCEAGGKIVNCQPVCQSPLVRAGKKSSDPYCHAQSIPDNPCCAILDCTDSATEPEESCVFGNTTIPRGQKVEDGCEKICICEAGGHLKCQPRCPPNDTASGINQHDRCVVLQDPRDPACCTITLCDVTLGDSEIKPENVGDLSVNLTDVKVLNSTAIKLRLSPDSSDDVVIEISENNHVWTQVKPSKDGIISNLQPAHSYYVRVVEGTRAGPAIHVVLLAEVIKTGVPEKNEKGVCNHRGKTYKIGAEWYDDCIAVCFCNETAQTECVTIECPTDFGLDVLDPHCLEWETVPPNHVAKAPNCCPQEVRCRNNGSCIYEGGSYDNWSRIPANITGCQKECYCEFGNVTCSEVCPPVSPQPPSKLSCKGSEPILTHLPDDECCLHWTCSSSKETTTAPGKNSTAFIYPGSIDPTKKPKEKPELIKPSSYPWPVLPGPTHPPQPPVPPNSDVVHYPMDPGHPTVPYAGPYNPDYKPTQPSVDDVFHLNSHEKTPPVKDKTKSKSDSKKPVDVFKPHKENSDQFPGPIVPDRYPEKPHPPEKPVYPSQIPLNPNVPQNPNKLPGPNKMPSDHAEQPQFIPLNPQDHVPGHNFDFTPSNGESIPPTHFDTLLENPAAGPPYGARPEPADPNNVVPSSPKKKVPGSESYSGDKGKPNTKRPDLPQRLPHPESIPDELYHLINLQHPGLINLNHGPPNAHPGLYDIHQEIANGGNAGNDKAQQPQIPPNYFGPGGLPPKKGGAIGKPQIYSQKDENGQTTYHVHASEVPNSPQQLEDLLAHIAQHDPNGNNPLYPGHYPNTQHGNNPSQGHGGPPPPPPHLGPHGFVPQASSGQSEYDRLPIGQFPGIPVGQGNPSRQPTPVFDIAVTDLRAISNHSVHLVISVPHFLTGLEGRVEVRYTSDKSNPDPLTWTSQIFAPPSDLLDNPSLEFELSGLEPATLYRLMIIVRIQDVSNTHASKVYEVMTMTPVDLKLRVSEVNATTAEVEWQFSNHEMQFIDATYLKYKAKDDKTYQETPLLHRSISHYMLEHLLPNTEYEIQLNAKDIIGQTGTLIMRNNKQNFTTSSDIYSFDVKVEIKSTKSTEVEIIWSGVPQPEEKYYNLIRAVYQSDTGKEGIVFFKKDKKETKKIINDLKPGTRYRLWLEVYQTNGQLKKSNVQDFVTKPGALPSPGASQQQGKLASSIPLHEGDYYGALVIVGILALMAILSTMILLMMLLKRRTSSKADISPRKTTSAYDNPSYKVELQQETMDL